MKKHLPSPIAAAAICLSGCSFLAVLVLCIYNPGAGFDVEWAPTWGLRLSFALDGLGALYVLLATGVGSLVFVYSIPYIRLHLEHAGRPVAEQNRFHLLLLLFMTSMVGLATSQDILLMFVFWDLTTISSYLLIGFDHEKREARSAALMALLVTGISAVFFLTGILLLKAQYGTFALRHLIADSRPGPALTIAAILIVLAALAKSAQVPFHFWLPRAMVAPAPVSAYLHSAAMVAAGVFLLARFYPLLQKVPVLLECLWVLGLVSVFIGSVLALTKDGLKEILAYSTIAQYGYVTTMLGFGGPIGAIAAAFYVMAHGLAKSTLFLTVGAIKEATGTERLSDTKGLFRSLPVLGVSSGVASAALAGLPLTIGFFKDELFFKAALDRGWDLAFLCAAGAALTLGYTWRFWSGIFLGGKAHRKPSRISGLLVGPIAVLAALSLLGGIAVAPFTRIAAIAGLASGAVGQNLSPGYHFDARPENLLAGAVYLGGTLLIVSRQVWSKFAGLVALLGDRSGPERWYARTLDLLNYYSHLALSIEVRTLRARISTVLVPSAVLVLLGLIATPAGHFSVGEIAFHDVPLILFLLLAVIAATTLGFPQHHLAVVIALSAVGYSLSMVYTMLGAPDVALVAVLIETVLTLLILGVLTLFPRQLLRRQRRLSGPRRLWRHELVIGGISGLAAFIVAWGTLSRPASGSQVANALISLTPAAHAKDIVTATLADFRGLDTLGEVTVIFIAVVGVVALLQKGKLL